MPGEETGKSPLKGCPPVPPHPHTDPVDAPAHPQQLQEQDQKPSTPTKMSPEDAPSTSPLAGEEGPGPLVQQGPNTTSSSSSAAPSSASPPATFNLTCMTCHTHFTSAELYTRHHCVASSTPVQDAITESSSDVEKFDGKIVYNPDGSAYIFDSEMSDEEGGVPGLELPRHEGSIVDSPRHPLSTTASPTIPTIANAIYVTKNPAFYTALYGQTFTSLMQENKVPDVPIVHNYRVFTIGDKDSENECKDSDSKNNSSSEKTKLPLLDYSQVPIKPILMCFVCKLSFGYVKSFIAHAMGDHSIVLVDEEKDLLASKNASAIIQCAGREEPRVSFLEPVIPPGSATGGSGSGSSNNNDCSSGSSHPGGPLATLLPSRAPSGNSPHPPQPSSPVKAAHNNNDAHQSSREEGQTSIVKTEMSDFYEMVKQQQQHHQQQQQHLHHHALQQARDPFAAPQHPAAVRTPDLSRKSPISALGANGRASVSPVTSMSPTSFSPLQSPVTQLTGTVIGACPEHMNGRPQGVNCDKCDLILQQSRQLGGQMAFMHSRNSCKTLKCPKCNWHYKYQETLEIHMKEKHPENESTCIYCLTNQPHPRLARGETYTCGYKPYRCEVCNYSTTTKGNLSIHMQSDKHLNNMQELQNGGMPNADVSMVSQSLTSQQQSPSSAIYSAPKTPTPSTTPASLQQQKPKPVWRCDVCNYETNVARNLRIHMTSEKHTHNMMVLQQNVKHMQQLSALQGNGGGGSAQIDPMALLQLSGNPAAAMMASLGVGEKPPMPEAALADLAYNQALLIQMMSGGQMPPGGPPVGPLGHGHGPGHPMGHGGHMGPSGDQPGPHFDLGLNPESLEPPPEPVPPNPRHAFSCCVCSAFSTDSLDQLNLHLQLDRSKANESEVLLVVAGNYICKLCSYKTNLKANFQLHCKTDKHLQKLQHVNHILEGGQRNEWKLKYLSNTNPMHVRCNLCEYYTNSVHKLQLHASHQRHEVLNVLFRHLCMTETQFMEDRRQYSCTLCNFTTRAKLQLLHHIRSVRHLQMEQLHQIQRHSEGKGGTQQDIGEIFKVEEVMDEDDRHTPPEETKEEGRSPDHVHACPFCHFTCDAESALQQHVDAEHGGEKKAGLRCPLCEEACPDMNALEKHAISVHSVNSEGLQRLLLLVRLSAAAAKEEEDDDHQSQQPQQQSEPQSRPQEQLPQRHVKMEDSQSSAAGKRGDERNVGREPEECGVCGVACGSVEDLLAHQTATGHIPVTETPRGPGYLCWKKGCNQYFPTAQALHSHFREIHGAVPRPSVAVSERHVYKYRCQQCSLAFKTVEKLQLHAQYHAIRDATKCLLCHRNFRSLGALQKHVSADHPELTEAEKHQFQASIFGAPVGAGAGPVLDPNTTALLRRESNKDDEIEEIPRIEDPPLPPHQQAIEDYLNSDTMALDNYSDPARRYKCHRCRVAFTRQSYLTVHQKTLLHRRGEKLTYPMEKYLDPNRPYKCDVCKESFTQKNILLVHYNSVSHLHKLKKAMQDKETKGTSSNSNIQSEQGSVEGGSHPIGESHTSHVGVSGSGVGEDEGNKPYRCHVCRVAYSQQSTLDIHLRSVLHQSRTARLPEYMPTASHDPIRTLGDQPQVPTSTPQPSPASHHEPNHSHSPSTHHVTPPATQHISPSSSSSAQGSCGRCGGVWSTAEQGAQHAVLCSLMPPQLNVLPHSVNNPSAALDAAWVSLCQANAANLPQTPAHDRSLSPSECSIESLSTSRFTVPFRKSSRLHKHLLESFGFDLVVQYVESQEPYLSKSQEDGASEDSKCKSISNLPELSKSKCPLCSKQFSSVWVLKAHLEEIHKSYVPFDYLKKFSDEYRKEYNTSRHSSSSEPSALTDDERGRDAEIVLGGEKGTSDEREKEAESGSRSDAAATPTSHTTPTPGVTPTSTTAPSVSPAADQHGMNVPPQMAEMAAALNALTAAQMQQMQFNPMMMAGLGLAGLPLQLNPLAAMNLHPPLMPMLPPHMFDHSAINNMQQQNLPTSGPSGLQADPHMFLKQHQQQIMQQQQQHAAAAAAAAAAAQQKRARTRITDEQLKILRAHFDINNSPTEDQINDMAKQSGLPPKVIKHWFRNTLFKERQRSKDSPYNFSIPPSTTLNLEEYEKTGEAKVKQLNPEEAQEIVALNCTREEEKCAEQIPKEQDDPILDRISAASPLNKVPSFSQDNNRVQEKNGESVGGSLGPSSQQHFFQLHRDQQLREQREQLNPQPLLPPLQQSQPSSQVGGGSQLVSSASSSPLGLPATPSFTSLASPQTSLSLTSLITSQLESNPMLAHKLPHTPPTVPSSGLIPPSSGVSPTPPHLSFPSAPQTPTSSSSISGKRANRTRFTDYQIKVLQEFFENNAYPKDDDLEYLSKLLNLSPRVIVVWFQNARQKARKVYENQPPLDPNDEGAGRFTRTPGLNYQCKKCLLVFQRYYELIRHQKTHCFKEEDAKRSAQAQAAAAQAAALYNDENSNHSSITESSQQSGSLDNKSMTETYQCDKCSLVFNRFEQWREHQIVHLMNPALFLNKGADSPFTSIQQQQQQSQPPPQQHQLPPVISPPQPSPLLPPASPLKRKTDESEDEREGIMGNSEGQRDKRLRTTILPEQLDYLYQKYQLEANPSRKMLETIAQEVGLKKRVVQVWFQNTRARERKGQFRAHAQVINKKCPFCPAIFKVKSALESHLSTKHADQYSKGDVDIDALPDVEDSGVGNLSLSSTPSTTQASQVMPSSFFSSPEVPEDSIAMYHEEAIRRYLNDVNLASEVSRREGESPLDLSKPLDLVRPLGFDSSLLDTSDNMGDHSDEESYHLDVGEPEDGDLSMTNLESNPTSPASSTTSSARPGGHHSASKRFRTQMSSIQVKIMKSVFRDYKTPTMAECELLGREIGLAKRVVQVWFQNARAKEKKAKLALQKMLGTEPEAPKSPEECKVCNFKYSHKYSVQDHLFTRSHIENMKMFLEKAKEESEVANLTNSLHSLSADTDKPQPTLTPGAGLAHQLQMAQLMALGSPPTTASLTASDDRKVGPGGSNSEDLSRLQLLQQMYQQMGLGGLQGAPHPLLQHAMMAGAGE